VNAGDMQRRYYIEETRVVFDSNNSAGSYKDVIRMRDFQNTTTAQFELKWLKWNGPNPFSKLFKHG
jgi:hypothetical protein